MAKKSTTKWIPFDSDGNLHEYDHHSQKVLDDPAVRASAANENWPTIFKPNYEFDATLTFKHFSFGRSAMRANYEDGNGKVYPMFISEFESLLLAGRIQGVEVSGKWTFGKRGASYGLIQARTP
jgi:hypothetical protein